MPAPSLSDKLELAVNSRIGFLTASSTRKVLVIYKEKPIAKNTDKGQVQMEWPNFRAAL